MPDVPAAAAPRRCRSRRSGELRAPPTDAATRRRESRPGHRRQLRRPGLGRRGVAGHGRRARSVRVHRDARGAARWRRTLVGGMVYCVFRQASAPRSAMRLLRAVTSVDALSRMSQTTWQLAPGAPPSTRPPHDPRFCRQRAPCWSRPWCASAHTSLLPRLGTAPHAPGIRAHRAHGAAGRRCPHRRPDQRHHRTADCLTAVEPVVAGPVTREAML